MRWNRTQIPTLTLPKGGKVRVRTCSLHYTDERLGCGGFDLFWKCVL